MRRFIYPILALLLLLAGCASEGGDPTEAVPADVFLVLHVPEVGLLWDGAESLLGELRQIEPRLADELTGILEEPAGELFGDATPQSLQDLWDLGVDVDKAYCVAVGGLPVPQTAVLVSVHDPSAFSDFYYRAIGEDKPAPVESYAEADIRLSRGVYSAFDEGLFLASDSLPLLKSCLDALAEPEKRFFAADSIRPLAARSTDDTVSLLVDFSAVRGPLALALTQLPDIPGRVKEWLTRLKSVGVGLVIQPEGVRLVARAYGDFPEEREERTGLPVPQDCLAFIGGKGPEVPLAEKRALAGLLFQLLEGVPGAEQFIGSVGEENLMSLVLSFGSSSFLFLHDAAWMPGLTLGLGLDNPELFRLIYDEKLRPLMASALAEELGAVALERRERGDITMDALTLEGPFMLPVTPALAFYDGWLLLTTDAGMADRVRDVDLGRSKAVYDNEDYRLVERQLPGFEVAGFASADKLVELLAMTPGLEMPQAVQLLADRYALVSTGGARSGDIAEAVLLVSARTYSPDAAVQRSEINRGPAWWVWLVIGLGAAAIAALVVILLLRRRPEA